MNWRTLRTSMGPEAILVAGFLRGSGVEVRVVDDTGAEVPHADLATCSTPVSVQVRDTDLPVATEILGDALSPRAKRHVDTPVERLGVSIRACAVSPLAPLGILLAPSYLLRAAREGVRPPEHAWTLAGIVACVPPSMFYAIAFHDLFLS